MADGRNRADGDNRAVVAAPGGLQAAPPDLGVDEVVDFAPGPARLDEGLHGVEDFVGARNGLPDQRDLAGRLAPAQLRDQVFGADEAVQVRGALQRLFQPQVFAVREAVSLGVVARVVDGDARRVESGEGLDELPVHVAAMLDDLVPHPGRGRDGDVQAVDDGDARPGAREEQEAHAEVALAEDDGVGRVAAGVAHLLGERDPGVDVQLVEEADGLLDFLRRERVERGNPVGEVRSVVLRHHSRL
ncbi:MAG: hypothetical protein M5R40_28560 [Anaerolineae bacterium]|nr:hypothetical protein [Anaerolineae bacterium]